MSMRKPRIGFRNYAPSPPDDGLPEREYGQMTAIAGWVGFLVERTGQDLGAIRRAIAILEESQGDRPEVQRGVRDFHEALWEYLQPR